MSVVFDALLTELCADRWLTPFGAGGMTSMPRPGQTYVRRNGRGLRRGRVLEIRPPLGVTLQEVMIMGSCRLHQHLRFSLVPGEDLTAVLIGARYRPDGLARLRIESWHRWLLHDQQDILARVGARLRRQAQGAGASGHSQGSTSMTVANIIRVRGKPIFR